MNKEQNIDDILKLLRDSVSVENVEDPTDFSPSPESSISHEELQEQLKNQYIDGENSTKPTYEAQKEYVIDSDFLTELENTPAEISEKAEDELTESVDEEFVSDGDLLDDASNEEKNDFDEKYEVKEEEPSDEPEYISEDNISFGNGNVDKEYDMLSEDDEELFVESNNELDSEGSENDITFEDVAQEYSEDVFDNDVESKENIDSVLIKLEEAEHSFDEKEVQSEDASIETSDIDDESNDYPEIFFVDEEDLDDDDIFSIDEGEDTVKEEITDEVPDDIANEPVYHETFLASMRKTGMDFTTDDIYKATVEDTVGDESDDVEETDASIEISQDDVESEELDMSTINLMMQFCEKEELKDTIGDEKVEDFLIFEQTQDVEYNTPENVSDGKEYVSEAQNKAIFESYRKSRINSLLTMIGCWAIAIVAFIYDLLPVFDVRLSGALDFYKYPSIYVLIGLQFVVFAVAINYKKLWNGLKRAFSLTPNVYSIVAIVLALTAMYDLIIAIVLAISGDELPMLYNAIAVIITAMVALTEYLDIVSEEHWFKVYSASEKKFTLTKETSKSAIGAKLYGGGLEPSKIVYSACSVDFPRGFFRSLSHRNKKNSILKASVIPILIIAMIAAIVSVIMGETAYASCAAFMIAVYTILPVSTVVSDSLPNTISSVRLSKRGSAIVGSGAVESYANCDIVVFDDSNLFKKCTTDEVGFAIYDTSVGYLVLGCLDALFSHIGGPLSGMKMEGLPDVFKFSDVTVKRIARNGVEAVIANRHSLIVGEHEFMRRYGLEFPADESENLRSTLCVSLNGKVTAKLSVKYRIEPNFEVIAERLYSEGIAVAVRTADPLINSKMIASARNIGDAPISVIHQGVEDIERKDNKRYREDADGVISCSSRLKLAELIVWIKRLTSIKKLSNFTAVAFSALGIVATVLVITLGVAQHINQLYILLYMMIELCVIASVMMLKIPHSRYFTADSLYTDIEKEHRKMIEKEQKQGKKNK